MSAAGEILEIDKLAPRVVPPEENRLPQMTFVSGQMSGFSFMFYAPTLRYVAPGKVVVISKLSGWPEIYGTKTITSWIEVAEQLAPIEAQIDEVLDLLERGTFGANLHYRSGFSQPITHLTALKSVAQILSTAAMHDLHQHQADAAFAKLKGLLATVQVEKEESLLMSQLVRIAMMHLACAATWQALQHDGWTDAQLTELQRRWAEFSFLPEMEKSMLMERAIAPIEFERFRTSDRPLSELLYPTGIAPGGSTLPWLSWAGVAERIKDFPQIAHDCVYTPIWKFAWSHHDELHYDELMQRAIVAHRQAVSHKSGSEFAVKLKIVCEEPVGLYDRLRFATASVMSDSLIRIFDRAWFAQARAELTITAIAIKRFHLRRGDLPGSLEDLVPEFLPKYPIDYMDGSRLKYCVDSDSFLLYSVGMDGHDDAGDDRDPTGKMGTFQSARDLVWPRPASDHEVTAWKASRK